MHWVENLLFVYLMDKLKQVVSCIIKSQSHNLKWHNIGTKFFHHFDDVTILVKVFKWIHRYYLILLFLFFRFLVVLIQLTLLIMHANLLVVLLAFRATPAATAIFLLTFLFNFGWHFLLRRRIIVVKFGRTALLGRRRACDDFLHTILNGEYFTYFFLVQVLDKAIGTRVGIDAVVLQLPSAKRKALFHDCNAVSCHAQFVQPVGLEGVAKQAQGGRASSDDQHVHSLVV